MSAGDRFGRRERSFCRSMSIFARSCSKCKKPWQDCSFVDIRACRHGLQIAPGRSWEAMLTRCCLRRGYERSPKGLWTAFGSRRPFPSSLRPPSGRSWASLGPSRTSLPNAPNVQDDPRRPQERFWSQLGANLEPTWTVFAALRTGFGRVSD